MQNKRIFITGGAGFLGSNIVSRYYNNNEITVYSRDEAKHYYLKKRFPNIKCVVGDVRNYDLLLRASKHHDIGIFAASLKQIEAVDQNVEEACRIIIDGAINSRLVAVENNFESACFISSDKSRAATTLYGAMKFVAGESFIVNSDQTSTKLSSAIYGNVLNSTGSIIPLIWDAIKKNYPLTLYSTEMTRFMISVDSAIDLVEYALTVDGYNVIPNLKAFRVIDLFEIYANKFGLKYQVGTPRISEKIHEILIAEEEKSRTIYNPSTDTFLMHYKDISIPTFDWTTFSSANRCVTKDELNNILLTKEYYNAGC